MKGAAYLWWTTAAMMLGMGMEGTAGPEWGKSNKEGIVVRVVPLVEEFRIGKAMMIRIEAKNTGAQLVYADLQSLAHCDCLLDVVNGEGREVPAIGAAVAGCQTIQSYHPLPPGKVVAVVPQVDVGLEFAILQAGRYRLRFPGIQYLPLPLEQDEQTRGEDGKQLDHTTRFTQLPASAPLEIVVADGELTPEQAMIKALLPVVPEGWFVCRRWEDRGIMLGENNPEVSVAIDLVAVDPRGKVGVEEGYRRLGKNEFGEIRMKVAIGPGKGVGEVPEDVELDDYWMGAEEEIRKALGIEPGGR
jgi:hypothetical protein